MNNLTVGIVEGFGTAAIDISSIFGFKNYTPQGGAGVLRTARTKRRKSLFGGRFQAKMAESGRG
jgi:hypothetical protein